MTLDKITSVLPTGGQHLGDIVYWTLAEARIDRSALENIWTAVQLSPAMLPDPPTAEKAFKTAVRETAVGQHDRLIRLGLETEKEIVFAVVRETKHEDGCVSYTQETRVVLDRAAERVTMDVPAHDLATVIAARFGELRATHTPDDIRRAMMKTLDACSAVTLRDHGGVYWVPAPYADSSGGSRGPSRRSAARASTCSQSTPPRMRTAPWAMLPRWPSRTSWRRSRRRSMGSSAGLRSARPRWSGASTPSRGSRRAPTSTGTFSRCMSRIWRRRSTSSPPAWRGC